MPFMYILECRDGSLYVGSTRNLEKRLNEHNLGFGSNYTRSRLPVELKYSIEFENIADAFAFEKRVQGWSRAKRLALIEGRFLDLPRLSQNRTAAVVVSTGSTTEVEV